MDLHRELKLIFLECLDLSQPIGAFVSDLKSEKTLEIAIVSFYFILF